MKTRITLIALMLAFLLQAFHLSSQTFIYGYSENFVIGKPIYEAPNIFGYSGNFTLRTPMYEAPNIVGYSGVFGMNTMGEYIMGYSGWFALNTVWMPLTASYNANIKNPGINQAVQFTDQSIGTVLPNSWVWDFGDGTPVSNKKNPVHSYQQPGKYKIKLTVTNSIGAHSIKEIPDYITLNSENNGIELQIVETGEQGVVKWVGYQYRNQLQILCTVDDIPVENHQATITWDSKFLWENDFNDEILLFGEESGTKMQIGHISYEYEHSDEKGFVRNSIIIFHNDNDICSDGAFPYNENYSEKNSGWDYYEIGEYPVSMLVPPDNQFKANYSKIPLLLIHGWEGSYCLKENPDADVTHNETSYWFTTAQILNNLDSPFDTWQYYYPYNSAHRHLSICLRSALSKLKEHYENQKIRIVTHSMGGLITLRYLTEFPVDAQTKVEKVLFSAPPAHGSLGANMYYKTILAPLLEVFVGMDKNAPSVRDLKLGSDATIFINNNSLPDLDLQNPNGIADDYFVLLGTTFKWYISDAYFQYETKPWLTAISPFLFGVPPGVHSSIHTEASQHHDGIVSISSGSLLDKGVGFATFHGNHNDAVHMQSYSRNNLSKQNIGNEFLLPNIIKQYFLNDYPVFRDYIKDDPYIQAIVNPDRSVAKPVGQNLENLNTNNDVDFQKGLLSIEFAEKPSNDVFYAYYSESKKRLSLRKNPLQIGNYLGRYNRNVDSENGRFYYFNDVNPTIGKNPENKNIIYNGCAIPLKQGINEVVTYNFWAIPKTTDPFTFRYCETAKAFILNQDNSKDGSNENYTDNKEKLVAPSGVILPDSILTSFNIDDQAVLIDFNVSSDALQSSKGNVSLKVKLPDGTIPDSTLAGSTYSSNLELGVISLKIPSPLPGTWYVWLESENYGVDTLSYNAVTILQSELFTWLPDSIIKVAAYETKAFRVAVKMNDHNVLEDISVVATIISQDGTEEAINISNTGYFQDSSYFFTLNHSFILPGEYLLKYNLDGVYNDFNFERCLYQPVVVIDTLPGMYLSDIALRQLEPHKTIELAQSVYNISNFDTLFFTSQIISTNLDTVEFSAIMDSLALNVFMTTNLADTGTAVMRFDCHYDDKIISDTVQVKVLLPDLEIDSLQLSDSVLNNGSEVGLNFEIANTGNYHSGAFDVRYYISADTSLEAGDYCLGLKEMLYQNVESDSLINDIFELPTLNLSGEFYVLVKVDGADQIIEPNETNNLAYCKVILNPPPGPPAIISTIPDDGKVQISWTSNGQPGNTGYIIHYGTDSTGVLNKIYTLSSDTVRLITGLTNETTYYFAVSAYRLMGVESDRSSFAGATPSLLASQILQISQGWSGLSIYFTPLDANVETMLQPIANDLIILESETGMYWPGQNVNTIGNWDTHEGYKIKVANTVALSLTGLRQIDKTLQLVAGWNLIPVLSECPADAVSLFAGKPLIIVKEVAGWNMYWPEFGINTLEVLEPGKAYFVMMSADDSVIYPDCQTGMKSWIYPSSKKVIEDAQCRKLLIENKISRTAITHTIAFPVSAFNKYSNGGQIMALDESGNCFGLTILNAENTSLTLFGDDPVTPEKDGFSEHETITFRMKTQESTISQELADVVFDSSLPQHEGLFYGNGLSSVTDFRLKTAMEGLGDENEISIYPNPSGRLLYLQVKTKGNLTFVITNMFGQQILKGKAVEKTTEIDLSSLAPGVYTIAVFNENLQVVKQIIKK